MTNRHVLPAAIVACLLTLSVASAVRAQSQTRPRRVSRDPDTTSEPAPAPDEPVALDGTLVEVPVVVADRAGRYVPTLTASDFELFEDGVRQRIVFFRNERVPIHVAILLDTSSSTKDSLDDIQDAAIEFTNQLLPGDQILVISFDGDVRVEQEFTSDRGKLVRAIKHTKTRKGTKLYDSVYETVTQRFRNVDGRKALVLLSDGHDSRSHHSSDEAVNATIESDILVYGIRYAHGWGGWGLPIPGKGRGIKLPGVPKFPRIPKLPWPLVASPAAPQWPSFGNDFMETITANSGGKLYEANAVSDLNGLFAEIAEELRHVYTVAYEPTNPVSNGGYRTIEVRVPARPDLAVRHRLGYLAK